MQSLEALSIKKGTRVEGTEYANVFDNGVAVLDLIGPIYPRANMMTMSGATSIAQFTKDFISAYNHPDVKALVLNIDSPGGDVRGIGEAADLMFKVAKRGKKPVKSYAAGYMASAAYYVGSVAHDITGNESSLTGSIGVVLTARAKGKDEIEIVSSVSPHKRPDPSTEEGSAVLREQVDDLANIFVKDVARFRGISTDKVVSNYGQGKCLVGPRAKKHGLIDKIGTLASTVEEAAKEASSRTTIRHRSEAIEGTIPAILQFEEDDDMGLKELVNKFKASNETTLDVGQALDAPEESKTEGASGQSEEDVEQAQTPVGATQGIPVTSREEYEERFADAAELFAVKMTTSHRIDPAQQAQAACDLINAKIDDAKYGGMVSFVNNEGILVQGTREAAVHARYESLPQHTMTQQAIKAIKEGSVVAKVLAEHDDENVKTEGPLTDERKAELLRSSDLGQQVLAARK